MPKRGRQGTRINWELFEHLQRAHANIHYTAKQLGVSHHTLTKAIKKKYGVEYVELSHSLHQEGIGFIVAKIWQKASQGNDKWMAHLAKFYGGHNDFELQKQVEDKYQKNESEALKSSLQQIAETSLEMLKIHGPIAEPRPENKSEINN